MGLPSPRCPARVALAGVRIELPRHRSVCVAPDPHDRPLVDFLVHQQRCASRPRVAIRHVADTALAASSSKAPVKGSRIPGGPWLQQALGGPLIRAKPAPDCWRRSGRR